MILLILCLQILMVFSKEFSNQLEMPTFLKKIYSPPQYFIPEDRANTFLSNFTTYVDHFNLFDNRTFQMRYWTNNEFFQPGGPIFIFVGGEWDISFYVGYLLSGQMFDMAKKTNGIMFHTEHRYYGQSYPFGDISTDSLKYLNVDQALTDLANFIQTKKLEDSAMEDRKVVLVGASYSATLATWIRQKYPYLVDAVLASSAPVLAIEQFYQYYDLVGQQISETSPECWNLISEATATIDSYLNNSIQLEEVSSKFNTCEPILPIEPHRGFFFSSITEVFAGIVQYAKPGDIQKECKNLLAKPGPPLDKLASFVSDRYSGGCLSNYDDFITWYGRPELPVFFDMYRQFYYQCCTEFGFWQITKTPSQPFGEVVPVQMYQQMCKDLFGSHFTPELTQKGIERTNIYHGGLEINITHVVSIHGRVDPWHTIGIVEDMNLESSAIVIEGSSHCADLNSDDPSDSPSLRAARVRTRELILEWIDFITGTSTPV